MSLPAIKIVDIQHDNENVEIESLTQTALESLIFECEQLLDGLKDAEAKQSD